MSTMIRVQVPGFVPRTHKGNVRTSTLRRLVREARAANTAANDFAAVEILYQSSTEPHARDHTTVTFDPSKPAAWGF